MHEKKIIEDLFSFGSDALLRLFDARHDIKKHAKNHIEHLAQKLDLVSRDEFDAAFAMLAKARDTQEDILHRLSRLESVLNLSSGKKTVKTKKQNLPSVKTKKKRATPK